MRKINIVVFVVVVWELILMENEETDIMSEEFIDFIDRSFDEWKLNVNDIKKNEISLAIDFGMQNIVVMISANNLSKVQLLPNLIRGAKISLEKKSFPAIICFNENGYSLGNFAKRNFEMKSLDSEEDSNEDSDVSASFCIISPKMFLGKKMGKNPDLKKYVPENFICKKPPNNDKSKIYFKVPSSSEPISITKIIEYIFRKIKQMVQYRLKGVKIVRTAISVPIDFEANERVQIKIAAKNAGLGNITLVEEPVAAIAAFQKTGKLEENYEDTHMILDFGAGSLDMVIFKMNGKRAKLIGQYGDNNLGGKKFTEIIQNLIFKQFPELRKLNQEKKYKIWQIAEKIKITLSAQEQYDVDLSNYTGNSSKFSLKRENFESHAEKLFNSITNNLDKLFTSSNFNPEEISNVFLIGGSSKIPKVKKLVEEFFQNYPDSDIKIIHENSTESVAFGALFAINNNTAETGSETIVASSLVGKSLGIGTAMGKYIKLIKKGTTTPCSGSYEVYAPDIHSKSFQIDVFQGEFDILAKNDFYKTITIQVPQNIQSYALKYPFKIIFTYDKERILHISAEHDFIGINTLNDLNKNLNVKIDDDLENVQKTDL